MTDVIQYPWTATQAEIIQSALKTGKTIAFPTETFYGLGGNVFIESLIDRIFEIKERPQQKSLLLLASPKQLEQLVEPWSTSVQTIIDTFWPGPLTLIFKAHPKLPSFLVGPNQTIAIRHSSNPIVNQLIELGDCPIIGTSANLSNHPECQTAQALQQQLKDSVDLIIDGGPSSGGKVSTLLNVATSPFQIIRPGAISESTLHPYLH